ncbi:MAG TPA: type II and III secretion system protein family protein [Xanthobacteraceae bacterium]|nr:type II and III secretion system protein family protein [Xanthobacteraceae bacterium]
MVTKSAITATLATALVIGACIGSGGQTAAGAASGSVIQVAAADAGSRFIGLGVGKSVVIDLPRDIKDVLVANPEIANAVVRSTRRAYLIGAKVGQTNIYFFDIDGRQIAGFDIAVTRDLNGVRAALKQLFPQSDIRIEGVGDGVVLSGTAGSPTESQQAFDMSARLVGDAGKVANNITIRGRDQVMIKVTVAEVNRSVIKQLGVDFNGSLGYGTSVISLNTSNPFSASGQPISNTAFSGTWKSITATLQAMEQAGVLRTLAEPNLTAISGESANFTAGGEFPVFGGYTCSQTAGVSACQPTINYKKFGVGLNFTPVVLAEGRISMKVMSEVSELTTDNAIQISQPSGNGTTTTVTIPGIKVRRAETTLELPSGGSLAMAGMIQEQTKQQINGVPGIMQLPILGALFKSRDYINNQTELMVIVTPFIVHAVARKELSQPDDGFADASDPATTLLGQFNRIYGSAAPLDRQRTYRGNYGFSLD